MPKIAYNLILFYGFQKVQGNITRNELCQSQLFLQYILPYINLSIYFMNISIFMINLQTQLNLQIFVFII